MSSSQFSNCYSPGCNNIAVEQLNIASLSLKHKDLGLASPSASSTGCCPPELTCGSLPGAGPAKSEPTAKFLDTAKARGFLAHEREKQGHNAHRIKKKSTLDFIA